MPRHHVLLLILLVTALLQGCTISRGQIRRADAIVAASVDRQPSCNQADHCAQASPLLDAATQAIAQSTPQQPHHVVTLLDDSQAALVARINLIHAAQHSIDIQTYIWDEDDIGWLMLDALIDAARRGVQVRILADQLFSLDDPALLAKLARVSPNFQVRLYNPTFANAHTPPLEFAAGIACCFMRFNQRMHNKLMLVDDSIGITGGRNYQNRYFNWDNDFDYLDREVMVGGPAASQMSASFNVFWNLKRSVPLTHLRDVNRQIQANPQPQPWTAPRYTDPSRVADAIAEARDPDWLSQHLVQPTLRTAKVEYFYDRPAKTEDPGRHDALQFTSYLMKLIGSAQKEVVLQTPYLVMSGRARHIFSRLHKSTQAPLITVSTNSLASTDAFAVYAVSYKHRKTYLKRYGFDIYELKPHAPLAADAYEQANVIDQSDDDDQPITGPGSAPSRKLHFAGTDRRPGLFGSNGRRNQPAPLRSNGRRFGLHAKSLVVDDSFAMVGSHNFDPRSDHFNTEGGVIVYDARFAQQLRASIMAATAPDNAWVIAPRKPTVPVLGQISQAIGDVSARLPFFDIWPFRYATSYEKKAGCAPMRPDNPDFSRCYDAVGDFPDVAISPKLLYTRLMTAFGAGVTGVL